MFYIGKYEMMFCDIIDEINMSCKTPNWRIIQRQLHNHFESESLPWAEYDR